MQGRVSIMRRIAVELCAEERAIEMQFDESDHGHMENLIASRLDYSVV